LRLILFENVISEKRITSPSKLFEHISGGYYFSKDEDGQFLYCNNNLIQLFNLNGLHELKNKTDFSVLRDDIASKCRKEDLEVMDTELGYENKENLIIDLSGQEYHFTTTKIPLRNINGKVIGVEGWMFLSNDSVPKMKPFNPFESSLEFLEKNYDKKITIEILANRAHMSKSTFSRKFNETYDMSPLVYIKKYRLRKACELLKQGIDISSVTNKCGFCDQSHFTKAFRSCIGVTPKEYQRLNI